MRRDGAPSGFGFSAVSAPTQPGAILPVINLFGLADSRTRAVLATKIDSAAFVSYLTQQQNDANIPDASRVEVQDSHCADASGRRGPSQRTLRRSFYIAVLHRRRSRIRLG